MDEKQLVELMGTSHEGIDDALQQALKSSGDKGVNWYEVIETSSSTDDQQKCYQVKVKARLETA